MSIQSYATIETPGTGTIFMFAGSTAPAGWLMCTGQAVSRTTYAGLFSVIGTTYGTGDGSTTFNVPNISGRFPTQGTPGATGGSLAHAHPLSSYGWAQISLEAIASPGINLTQARIPVANYTPSIGTAVPVTPGGYSGAEGVATPLGGNTDNNAAMTPPYVNLSFLIKT
jgi:microcystin-dependent protein